MDDHAKALPLDVENPVAVAIAHLEDAPPPTRDQRRSRRHREVRARTISTKRMTKRELELGRLFARADAEEGVVLPERPRARAECAGGPRPCPFVSCKHHLYLDVSPRTGAIKLNFPDLEPAQLVESCALDVADRGGSTLDRVGEVMNVTRERIRQVEVKALAKVLGAVERGEGVALAEHAAPGPAGKRRLPLLQPRDPEENEDLEQELEDEDLEILGELPGPELAGDEFDVDAFVACEDPL
jgi:hypothetical protein